MGDREDNFLKNLLATFRVEAEEHLQSISSELLELEKTASDERRQEVVEKVFREAHSLKGAARSVNLTAFVNVCQSMESVFSALKRRTMTLVPAHLDLLHETVESLRHWVKSLEEAPKPAAEGRLGRLLEGLEKIRQGLPLAAGRAEPSDTLARPASEPAAASSPPAGEEVPVADTVRIRTARLDSLFLQAEGLRATGLNARQRAAVWRDILAEVTAARRRWRELSPGLQALRRNFAAAPASQVNGRKTLASRSFLELLDSQESFLKSLEYRMGTAVKTAELDQEQLNSALNALLEEAKQTLMLPCARLLEVFPPLARRLAREQGKEVELVVQGEEIEIDKRILEELRDPLIHIVRNCIDHGIEAPGVRRQAQKPAAGRVTLTVARRNGRVEFTISDDGGGIDAEKVRTVAVKLGMITPEEASRLDAERTLALVFESGISTSPVITDLSGRGLGLAIVREKVENLGGSVFLTSRPEAGTTLRLVLPITLTAFRGVLVRAAGRPLVIPTAHLERVLRIDRKEIKTVENRETIPHNGQAVSLVRLGEVLELPPRPAFETAGDKVTLVLLRAGEKRIAFAVDEVVAEQEVLVKDLGKQLARVRNVAGATVLGTGQIVPILNVTDLVQSVVKVRAGAAPRAHAPEAPARRAILVAEDSITARTLLKNILETAGYDVKTAVDGAEALAMLKSGTFALLVSDVDMPRMNGFELTAKLRADKKLSELPVVLVTALESREDRERGVEAGANAYIVKSSFDQSNLLSVVRRLI